MSALPSIAVFKKGEEIKSLPIVDEILVGRGENCVIRLDDKAVSRMHAVFRKNGKDVEVQKKSDFAPIIVNGEECDRKTLKHGDVIEIGPYRVKVTIPEEPKKVERFDGPIGVEEVNESGMSSPVNEENHTSIINVDFSKNAGKKSKGGESSEENAFSFDQKKSLKRQQEENDSTSAHDGTIASIPTSGDEATRIQSKNIEARLQIPDGYATQASYDLGEGAYSIGRGKGCDIVLLDKKSSRKNSEIRKEGNRFIVRDLDSANGTFVNGKPIKEQELYHDDLLRIGEAQIRFVALNKSYEKKKEQIENAAEGAHTSQIVVNLPVEDSGNLVPGTGSFSSPSSLEFEDQAESPYSAVPPPEDPSPKAAPKSGPLGPIYQKYVVGFKDLKPLQKLIPIFVAVVVAYYFFEDEITGKPVTDPGAPAQTQGPIVKSGKPGEELTKTYEGLSVDEKKYVDTQIQISDDAFKSMDYEKTLFEVKKIYRILPNYDRAKELERYSIAGKRRLEVKAEEKKKKDEAERVKARVAELEGVAALSMEKKDYGTAKTQFDEIMTLDPENAKVVSWKKEIQALEEEKSRKDMEARVEKEKNQLAWDTYNEGLKLFKAGDYHAAVPIFEKVADVRASDKKVESKAAEMKKASLRAIINLREPLLKKGRAEEAAGNLSAAYRSYEKATKIDAPHPEGYEGMDRIRDTLTAKSKAIFIEAVVLESYSDFKAAFLKYNQILEIAPEGSDYYMKAKRKLKAYQNFNPEEG